LCWSAVRAILSSRSIEDSYDSTIHSYKAQPEIARWENCREQGYVIVFRVGFSSPQLNIAFFEHRNSDSICAIEWEQSTINTPTIDTMDTNGKVYKDKWDVSKSVNVGNYDEMADWIMERLEAFWHKHDKKVKATK
jgi:hypothetical protein